MAYKVKFHFATDDVREENEIFIDTTYQELLHLANVPHKTTIFYVFKLLKYSSIISRVKFSGAAFRLFNTFKN